MSATISRLSTEFIWFPITTVSNLDGATVEVAFTLEESANTPVRPIEDDWNPADLIVEGGKYWVRILVGPALGGVNLAPNRYGAWVRLTDNPEVPVRATGFVTVT